MPASEFRYRQPKQQLDAGGFQPEISSFGLYLAAEGKAAKTVRTYTEAVQWFAAAHLLTEAGWTRWEEAGRQDVQQWMVCGCWSGTAPHTPATSSAPCSSSSNGSPPRRRSLTRWPG